MSTPQIIVHLFNCCICGGMMANTGRDQGYRCLYCATVYRGISDEEAKREVTDASS